MSMGELGILMIVTLKTLVRATRDGWMVAEGYDSQYPERDTTERPNQCSIIREVFG